MRKLLLLFVCALATIVARADIPSGATPFGENGSYWIVQNGVATVYMAKTGDIGSSLYSNWSYPSDVANAKKIVITTASGQPFNQSDAESFWAFTNAECIDLSGADISSLKNNGWINAPTSNPVFLFASKADGDAVWAKAAGYNGYKWSGYGTNDGTTLNLYVTANTTQDNNGSTNMLSASVVGDASDIVMQNANVGTLTLNNNLKNSINTARNNDATNRISSLTIVDGVLQNSSWTYSNTWIKNLNLADFNANNYDITFNNGGSPATTHIESVNLTGATNLSTLNLSSQTELSDITLSGVTSLPTLNLTDVNLTGLTIIADSEDVIGTIIPETDGEGNTIDYSSYIQTGPSGMADVDGCYITIDETTKTATVHAPTAGHFAALFYKHINYNADYDSYTFKFDSESNINEDDLKALAGGAAFYNSNKYYVDLFDVPATSELCDDETGTITNVIKWMRNTNDGGQVLTRQFKGLILPKDHTQYGIGTTLIQGEVPNTAGQVSTCSEFIAYYKSLDEQGNQLDESLTVGHVYDATNTNSAQYAKNLSKMMSLLNTHEEITSGTDIYQISTNSKDQIALTGIPSDVARIETYNNEMVTGTTDANIIAYPSVSGDLATSISATGISNTKVEKMTVVGAMNSYDYEALASFGEGKGPRVLDLSQVTSPITSEFLSKIENNDLEFIVLPNDAEKSLIMTDYSSTMPNLKAVINAAAGATSQPTIVANIYEAGSLYEARCHALARPIADDGNYYLQDLTGGYGVNTLTLAGKLNAADIKVTGQAIINDQGHWDNTYTGTQPYNGLKDEGGITTIDLEKAVFETQTDMNFAKAALTSASTIVLPTSEKMNLIPADCFNGITSFTDICVPYNYTKIDNGAFNGTYLSHLTTTDSNGALIDNGPRTYTFSKNLEYIGTDPGYAADGSPISLAETVFPQNRGVTDIYALAHKVPKCYAGAFPASDTYGWGGIKGGNFPYCREKYDNSSDGSMIFTVLHYPDETSFNATAATDKETSYDLMEKLYTDVNKQYSKKDQTGAVDSNGDAIAWPTFPELRRAYNQATDGITWFDWTTTPDANGEAQGFEIPTPKDGIAKGTGQNTYNFSGYEGWHQIVLSTATFVEPDKNVVNNVIQNNYVQGGWYTICIPFDLTLDMAIEMLGIPKSVEGKVENYLDGVLVDDEDKLPDLRQLQTVTRTPGTAQNPKNVVLMKFTQNLLSPTAPRYWNIDLTNPLKSDYAGTGATDKGEKIAIKGGYPYLIRPYLPANEVVNNIGKYVMTRFAEVFNSRQDLSCYDNDGCYQDLAPYSVSTQTTGRFGKPFENHKIQAKWDDNDNSTPAYRTHSDGKKYYYTFIGQFWDQKLPRYSFYMVENKDNTEGRWYRLASEKEYKWNKYKCIIMVTPEVVDVVEGRSYLFENSGLYRSLANSKYPVSKGTDGDGGYKFEDLLYIEFLNGLDDADFTEAAGAKYVFTFDDFIQEIDENGNSTTAIESLDGQSVNAPVDWKVYNMAGQYVGDSINGLGKGMYIVKGKKVVIK